MLAKCVASIEEVEEAKNHGKMIVSESVDGRTIAYLWNEKIYVVEVCVYPESKLRPLMGDRAICASCGDDIEWNGQWWRHLHGVPRHPGVPKQD